MDQKQINRWFSDVTLDDEQAHIYREVLAPAKILAETINKHVPEGPDKTVAIRKIREAVLIAIDGLATQEPV